MIKPRTYSATHHAPSSILKAACFALFLIVTAGPALAQTTPPPSQPPSQPASPPITKPDPAHDPALNDPSIDDDAITRRRAPDSQPIRPSNPASVPPAPTTPNSDNNSNQPIPPVGGLSNGGPGIPKGQFLPEGTFISARPGAIVRSPGGTFLFVPAQPSEGIAKVVPMILLPNQRLAQVASSFEQDDKALPASVSGQAFLYRGKQYILMSVFSMSHDTQPATKVKPDTSSVDADVRALMAELDARPAAPRAMDLRVLAPTSESPATTPTGKPLRDNLIAEGTVITQRRARLVRGGSTLSVMFDNGPSNPNLPAMPLLPCRLLEQLEALAASRGENLSLKVSGRVTVHNGRDFLLPTMYQIIRPGDITPMQ